MSTKIVKLLDIMATLRTPVTGCPWDLEQTFDTIAPYTIEEAYEVADAIERNDMMDLKDELGDLLLQVVFHSRMAEEKKQFAFDDVVENVSEKMIRRHPHIFSEEQISDAEGVKNSWEETKAAERKAKGLDESALDGVAKALPALLRAEKLTKRAARVNFDWPSHHEVFDKIQEEIIELQEEINADAPIERIEDELGDLLFCIANLARHFKLDPEQTLKKANAKFERRFKAMEASFKQQGQVLAEQNLDDMENRWQEIKKLVSDNK